MAVVMCFIFINIIIIIIISHSDWSPWSPKPQKKGKKWGGLVKSGSPAQCDVLVS